LPVVTSSGGGDSGELTVRGPPVVEIGDLLCADSLVYFIVSEAEVTIHSKKKTLNCGAACSQR